MSQTDKSRNQQSTTAISNNFNHILPIICLECTRDIGQAHDELCLIT